MITERDITIDTSRLDRAIDKALRDTSLDLEKITRQAGIFFAQSAALATPPDEGRRTFRPRTKNRPVIMRKDKYGRRRYKVPYRTAKAKGVKWFSTQREARQFSVVKWRGIGRAGWWAALPAFGASVAAQPGTPAVKAAAGRWGRGMMQKQAFAPAAVVVNMADTVKASFAQLIANKALRKTGSRMIGMIRAEQRKMEVNFK